MDKESIKVLVALRNSHLQSKQLKQQEEADYNRAVEAERLAEIQLHQLAVTKAQSEQQEETNNQLIKIENSKLIEERKRTKIALESQFNETDVFEMGYNFDFNTIELDDKSILDKPDGVIKPDGSLYYDFENLCKNLFLIPKLNKAFLSGVMKRWSEIQSEGLKPEEMLKYSFDAGKKGKIDFSIVHTPKFLIDKNFIFKLSSKSNIFTIGSIVDTNTGNIRYFLTSKSSLPFKINEPEYNLLNSEYEKGLNLYIENKNRIENTQNKINKRLEQERNRLQDEENAEINLIIFENSKANKQFENENIFILFVFSICFIESWIFFHSFILTSCILAVSFLTLKRKPPTNKPINSKNVTIDVKLSPPGQLIFLTTSYILIYCSILIYSLIKFSIDIKYVILLKFIVITVLIIMSIILLITIFVSYKANINIEINDNNTYINIDKKYNIQSLNSILSFNNSKYDIINRIGIGNIICIKIDKYNIIIPQLFFNKDDLEKIKNHIGYI